MMKSETISKETSSLLPCRHNSFELGTSLKVKNLLLRVGLYFSIDSGGKSEKGRVFFFFLVGFVFFFFFYLFEYLMWIS